MGIGCTWLTVALLGQGHMADTLVVWVSPEVAPVCDVIEVLDAVLLHHISACPGQSLSIKAHALSNIAPNHPPSGSRLPMSNLTW